MMLPNAYIIFLDQNAENSTDKWIFGVAWLVAIYTEFHIQEKNVCFAPSAKFLPSTSVREC